MGKQYYRQHMTIDDQIYSIEVIQNVCLPETATRIIIPTLILNQTVQKMIEVCVASLQAFTLDDIEIWVVDNCSKQVYRDWLKSFNAQINIVLNRTQPINPLKRPINIRHKVRQLLKRTPPQMQDGSYANAIGLELGRRCINPNTQLLMTLHHDTLVTRKGWLRYLKSKLTDTIRAVSFRQDPTRVQALHIAGLLFDYTLFNPLDMDFRPNIDQNRYPNRPHYDVGDYISLQLWNNGYQTHCLQNTFNQPELSLNISEDSPFHKMLGCDLSFDDYGQICFMHLGRGTTKSINQLKRPSNKILPEGWIDFAKTQLLV